MTTWIEPQLVSEERAKGKSRRRSRLEITCDVLRVISQGIEKPTRIMQISNITWRDLLSYIETLLENQFIVREVNGARVEYRLTERGEQVLELYMKLREATAGLNLDEASPGHPNSTTVVGKAGENYITVLSERLRQRGFAIEEGDQVRGKSGESHKFDLVARAPDGSRLAYNVRENITKEEIVGLFVSQLDTGLAISVACTNEPSEESRKMAENFSISVELLR